MDEIAGTIPFGLDISQLKPATPMNLLKVSVLTCFSFSLAQAVPLAELTGDAEPALLDSRLQVSISGNVGSNPDKTEIGTGYWTSASVTGGTSSTDFIYTAITFTATGLSATESLDLTRVSFDYLRAVLNGSNPVMNVYLDAHDGNGYGPSLLLVDDEPTSSNQADAFTIPLSSSLGNGDSITLGFSYRDRHGASQRTHQLDNLVLEGTYDLDSDQPGIDLNNNGVSDVWEYRFGAIELVKDAASRSQDYDGDGFSNAQEAVLGTNPFQAQSRLSLDIEKEDDSELRITVPSVLGKSYQIYGSEDLTENSWSPTDPSFEGTGSDVGFLLATGDFGRYFYRAEAFDIDNDGDRLSKWEELNVLGFTDSDQNSATTTAANDYLQLKGMVQSALQASVTITAPDTTLYEDEASGIPITFTRQSTLGDGFLNLQSSASYQLIDTTRVASNAASASDYRLVDANGVELTNGIINLAAGEASTVIYVQPLADSVIETDEQLTLAIIGDSEMNLWIADAREVSSADYVAISQAGLFLSQASMGGTPATIAALANDIKIQGYLSACEDWIDEQMNAPRESTVTADCLQHQATYLEGGEVPSVNIQNFELVWWGKVTQSKEQLRHRVAFSLSQVFVTSAAFWANSERNNVWRSYTGYYDKLMDLAFSTHRDLLTTISYDPFMGVYLSSAQNRKADAQLGTFPDENYAREVMQLFSCGVYSQDQSGEYLLDVNGDRIENYDNSDITEMAEVFTGLGLTNESGEAANFDSPSSGRGTRYVNPMIMVEQYHDPSEKILLDGTVLPANSSGDSDIAGALDAIAAHPSTAPHLSRLLIKRLTSSNPSADYIARVTEAWRGEGLYGTGEIGSLAAVLKAILLDPEARDAITYEVDSSTDAVTVTPARPISGRIKEPILKWTQFYRFAQALSGEEDGLIRVEPKTKRAANDQTPDFGQLPMRAPSVFNYYASEYSPSVGALADAELLYSTDLTSPESEILSPFVIKQFESLYEIVNQDEPTSTFSYDATIGDVDFSINYNYLRYLYQKNITVNDFIDDLNLWLCNGQISSGLQADLVDLANQEGGATRENFAKILTILFNSSDFSVSY